jgi:hypothetical protein
MKQPDLSGQTAAMNLADIAPSLHAIWDDNPSAETRRHLVEKIDALHHRTFPSEFERFTLLLQDNAASLKGGISGVIYCDWLRIDGPWVDDACRKPRHRAALPLGVANHLPGASLL